MLLAGGGAAGAPVALTGQRGHCRTALGAAAVVMAASCDNVLGGGGGGEETDEFCFCILTLHVFGFSKDGSGSTELDDTP